MLFHMFGRERRTLSHPPLSRKPDARLYFYDGFVT